MIFVTALTDVLFLRGVTRKKRPDGRFVLVGVTRIELAAS